MRIILVLLRERQNKQSLLFNPLFPKSDQHQFSPNNINIQWREKVTRITYLITTEKCFDLLSNSLYWFFKEMYGISLENLNVDIGTWRVMDTMWWQGYWSEVWLACSRLSDSGEDAKEKDTRKVDGAEKRKVSSRFTFVFALSQFTGPGTG